VTAIRNKRWANAVGFQSFGPTIRPTYSQCVVTSRGEVSSIGVLYDISLEANEVCTLIASLPLEGMLLREELLGLPEAPLHAFDREDLTIHLL